MKRRIFIIALALAAVTAAIGTTVAKLLPVTIPVYVYNGTSEGAGTLKLIKTETFSGTITPGTVATGNVTVSVRDTRLSNQIVTRIGRNASGQPLIHSAGATPVDATANTIP